ncbi:hypothetical protein [Sandarakinorhabdus sp.]|uniref:hypothetical protein n=1 Tax=Sandarakinorhabdus sp. TaxID=1916663 RepID=UPI00286DCABE|nr:hypothetical protein [Sandarakinorhabdus sp.]
MTSFRRRASAMAVPLLALAACSSPRGSAPSYPVPSQQVPPPIAVGPVGPSDSVAGPQQVWHLRSALNVAALACRERQLTDHYNRLLKHHQDLFAQAYAAEQARYRHQYGNSWQTVQDREMTRLYNLFANQPSRGRFCQAAGSITARALDTPAADMPLLAARSLPALEGAGAR